jgi:hypothetical protein
MIALGKITRPGAEKSARRRDSADFDYVYGINHGEHGVKKNVATAEHCRAQKDLARLSASVSCGGLRWLNPVLGVPHI